MINNDVILKTIKGLAVSGLVSTLIACGGGGPGSTSVVAKGVITALGSIWVNGVEYETPQGGSYFNDDSSSGTAAYEVGQIVSLRGKRNADGVSGIALEVKYEAELEGAALDGKINGVTIMITPATNFSGALTNGVRYEVSGFWLDDTTIEATFIKLDDDGDAEDEVKGLVQAVDSTSITVNGTLYLYDDANLSFSVDDLVEIHFTFDGSNFVAAKVELEDDFFGNLAEGQEVEVEGAVNLDLTGCPAAADFKINLTCIDWDSATWKDGLTGPIDMASGLRVEAEGYLNADGVLVAEKIKSRGNRVRISSTSSNVNSIAGSFDLFFGAIQVTTQSGITRFEDGLTLDTLPASGIEVRGIRTGATSLLAIRIKSESVPADRHELRAEVDLNGADAATNTITVMSITSVAGVNTELEIDDTLVASGEGSSTTEAQINTFLNAIDDDANPANGPRDVIEVRVDTTNGGNGSSVNPYAADEIEIEHEDD